MQISHATSAHPVGARVPLRTGLPLVPLFVAALLTLSSVSLLALARHGLPGFASFAERQAWLGGHRLQWGAAWTLVGLSMAALVVLQLWWAARLRWREGTMPLLLLAGAGLGADLLGLLHLVTAPAGEVAALRSTGNVLAVGVATPLYATALLGLVSIDPRRTRLMQAVALAVAVVASIAVACLVLGFEAGLVVALGAVFGLVPCLCVLSALRFRRTVAPAATNAYRMCSTWDVAATPDELHAIFEAPETLERWWGRAFLRSAMPAGSERVELQTRGWLPYTLRLDARVTSEQLPARFVVETSGDLVGRCTCSLVELDAGVRVHFDWVVRAEKPIVRKLSWLLKPLFVSNHRWVMSQGRRGLDDELARLRTRRESA